MRLYPPYLGAGIRVTHVSHDFREIDVRMGLHWWNRNYVGTHFGGSLYSMIDPFLMLMFLENLGRDYVVWDKAATIRFKTPGRGLGEEESRGMTSRGSGEPESLISGDGGNKCPPCPGA